MSAKRPRKEEWTISPWSLQNMLKEELKRLRWLSRNRCTQRRSFEDAVEAASYSGAISEVNLIINRVMMRQWATEDGIIYSLRPFDEPSTKATSRRSRTPVAKVKRVKKGYAITYKSSMFCEHANECPQSCRCSFDCSCRQSMCPPIPPPEGTPVVLIQEDDDTTSKRKRKR